MRGDRDGAFSWGWLGVFCLNFLDASEGQGFEIEADDDDPSEDEDGFPVVARDPSKCVTGVQEKARAREREEQDFFAIANALVGGMVFHRDVLRSSPSAMVNEFFEPGNAHSVICRVGAGDRRDFQLMR